MREPEIRAVAQRIQLDAEHRADPKRRGGDSLLRHCCSTGRVDAPLNVSIRASASPLRSGAIGMKCNSGVRLGHELFDNSVSVTVLVWSVHGEGMVRRDRGLNQHPGYRQRGRYRQLCVSDASSPLPLFERSAILAVRYLKMSVTAAGSCSCGLSDRPRVYFSSSLPTDGHSSPRSGGRPRPPWPSIGIEDVAATLDERVSAIRRSVQALATRAKRNDAGTGATDIVKDGFSNRVHELAAGSKRFHGLQLVARIEHGVRGLNVGRPRHQRGSVPEAHCLRHTTAGPSARASCQSIPWRRKLLHARQELEPAG